MARYIISDIHGCRKTLQKLLEEKIPYDAQNTFYFLGDYINKGPDSAGTMDYLIDFKEFNNCVFLRGNHDQLLLDFYHAQTLENDNKNALLESFKIQNLSELSAEYLNFISSMKYYVELDTCFLVHAGFNMDMPNIFEDKYAMLHVKNITYDAVKLQNKKIFHGHVPCTLYDLKKNLKNGSSVISIDTGCVYRMNEELNTLTAVDLDTHEVYFQNNIEENYYIRRR